MFRSYVSIAALVCLSAAIGCKSSDAPPDGMGGSGGSGGAIGSDEGTVTLGCTNNVSEDISILDWILTVEPEGTVEPGDEFTAQVGGTAFFAETFLDGALNVLTDLRRVRLVALAGTVQVRSGGTGDPVILGPGEAPYTCGRPDSSGDAVSCDPANDVDAEDPTLGNSDCMPVGAINPCGQFFDLPISEDCSDGGVCDMLGKNEGEDAENPGDQCARSGFCITGSLELPLETKTATYTAAADAAQMIFGWDDTNTGAEVKDAGVCSDTLEECDPANGNEDCADAGAGGVGGGSGATCDVVGDIWDLPESTLADDVLPNGVRISAGLDVLLRCTGGIDSADGTSYLVQDQASPSPDTSLLALQLGALCADVDCDDDNQCTSDVCDPADGSCSSADLIEGATCEFTASPGLCSSGICEDAMLCDGVDCTSDNPCLGDGTCNDETGRCDLGPPTAADTDCGDGNLCDGDGNCVECTAADQCEDDDNECTVPACTNGLCRLADVADGTSCEEGAKECLAGACVDVCNSNEECDDGNPCTTNTCVSKMCESANVADGTACQIDLVDGTCDGMGVCETDLCPTGKCDDDNDCTTDVCDQETGECTNTPRGVGEPCVDAGDNLGNCAAAQPDPPGVACELLDDPCQDTPAQDCEKVITVACGNNVTGDVSILPYLLRVDPTRIGSGRPFTATLGGVAEFSESFLDAAQGAITGGVQTAGLVDLQATVQTRGAGVTGANVSLSAGAGEPFNCLYTGGACNPANNGTTLAPGIFPNSDCNGTKFDPCLQLVTVPTSSDCAPSGVCDGLDKNSQCAANGFCVTGGLPFPLDGDTGSYMAGAAGSQALFGWFDDPPEASPGIGIPPIADGVYNILQPTYTGSAGPIGLAVNAGGLTVQLECVMGIEGGMDTDGDTIPDDGRPTPDTCDGAALDFQGCIDAEETCYNLGCAPPADTSTPMLIEFTVQ